MLGDTIGTTDTVYYQHSNTGTTPQFINAKVIAVATCNQKESDSLSIRIDPLPNAGTIPTAIACASGVTIHLENQLGDSIFWEYSTDSIVWNSVANSSDTIQEIFTEDRWYRATSSYQNQTCLAQTSDASFFPFIPNPSLDTFIVANTCAEIDNSITLVNASGNITWLNNSLEQIATDSTTLTINSPENNVQEYTQSFIVQLEACNDTLLQDISFKVFGTPNSQLSLLTQCENRAITIISSANILTDILDWEQSTNAIDWISLGDPNESYTQIGFDSFYYRAKVSNALATDCWVYSDTISTGLSCPLFIPNAISPNGDNANDVWKIDGLQNFSFPTVEVYNRYGAQVYLNQGAYEAWDGTRNGDLLPNGTYYYVIRTSFNNEDAYTGVLTISR